MINKIVTLLKEPGQPPGRLSTLLVLLDGCEDLDLSSIKLTEYALKDLCEALKTNTSLLTLDLRYNDIGDEGTRHLSDALKTNSSLVSLDINVNYIGAIGAEHLIDALKTNASLLSLAAYNNFIGDENDECIGASCERNRQMLPIRLALLCSILYFGTHGENGFPGGTPADILIMLLMMASPTPKREYTVKLLGWLKEHPPTMTEDKAETHARGYAAFSL